MEEKLLSVPCCRTHLFVHHHRWCVGTMFPPRSAKDWPYESCDSALEGKLVFIHPQSFVLRQGDNNNNNNDTTEDVSQLLPDYIVYTNVNENGRMEGCTEVESNWLRALSAGTVQCTDQICESPEPLYDAQQDCVFVYVRPLFGSRAWELPLQKVKCDVAKVNSSAFARALLEGKVVGKIIDENDAAAPYAHVTRAPLQPRVASLVGLLMKSKISSRAGLVSEWRKNNSFLKRELQDWVKSEAKQAFEAKWPAIVKKAMKT